MKYLWLSRLVPRWKDTRRRKGLVPRQLLRRNSVSPRPSKEPETKVPTARALGVVLGREEADNCWQSGHVLRPCHCWQETREENCFLGVRSFVEKKLCFHLKQKITLTFYRSGVDKLIIQCDFSLTHVRTTRDLFSLLWSLRRKKTRSFTKFNVRFGLPKNIFLSGDERKHVMLLDALGKWKKSRVIYNKIVTVLATKKRPPAFSLPTTHCFILWACYIKGSFYVKTTSKQCFEVTCWSTSEHSRHHVYLCLWTRSRGNIWSQLPTGSSLAFYEAGNARFCCLILFFHVAFFVPFCAGYQLFFFSTGVREMTLRIVRN